MRRNIKVLKDAIPNGREAARLTLRRNCKCDKAVSEDDIFYPFEDLRLRIEEGEIGHGRASGRPEDCGNGLCVRLVRAPQCPIAVERRWAFVSRTHRGAKS